MKERIPALIALFMLIALVISTWWAADYAQRAIDVDPPARKTREPDSWSDKFVMLSSDANGVPVNRLEGTHMQHFPYNDSYLITDATATGQRPNSPRTVGTGDTATMLDDGNKIVIRGNAHLHRFPYGEDKALDVRSEELIIYPNEDIITTDKPALVINGNSRMNGTGMMYNNKTRKLDVYSSSDVSISGQDSNRRRTTIPNKQGTPPQ
ncbi:hypothetical protein W822_10055 [Advenella kashmirensis W13003]|uniref:LPS export ABC transporter periplasmic protein LptC n=1 Tax=Advenella kashmirensis W13003 TaxID=1424334 RepID=V8QUW5_9BURK|nr:LPS export ABC transporter periplasmic protein LptC [Advenella kashmirensis]ETF03138.1 hypothetical protein W822_10055 [Advenella kashmirensis W13003]